MASINVCRDKAQHVREAWQDNNTATSWEHAARRIERAALSKEIAIVSGNSR